MTWLDNLLNSNINKLWIITVLNYSNKFHKFFKGNHTCPNRKSVFPIRQLYTKMVMATMLTLHQIASIWTNFISRIRFSPLLSKLFSETHIKLNIRWINIDLNRRSQIMITMRNFSIWQKRIREYRHRSEF